ncbi:Similar to hypothetical protein [Tuber melanosporum Mel28]; acc. no. XP_002837860 [Pyronema omphalodes CBS 100304]|uniref:DUF6594 domain-containing protein n=1 Tax=Pyronema omphalodes (strain CBS 100304) TaxID=1076935 RepID=U4LCY5_PYROM|nr:Similar to hypothetical protein [Tuber melanosporum Mel28]; acc. no. XP_002837860 [Pyronema omphalodes CBS 100304]
MTIPSGTPTGGHSSSYDTYDPESGLTESTLRPVLLRSHSRRSAASVNSHHSSFPFPSPTSLFPPTPFHPTPFPPTPFPPPPPPPPSLRYDSHTRDSTPVSGDGSNNGLPRSHSTHSHTSHTSAASHESAPSAPSAVVVPGASATAASAKSSSSETTIKPQPSITSHAYSLATSDFDRPLFDYRILAASMHAYRHLSIFRRFGRLSMANLLSYQDELTELEASLRVLNNPDTGARAGAAESDPAETRRQLMRKLRGLLKDYYETLLLQEQIFTLDPPRDSDVAVLGDLAPAYPSGGGVVEVDQHIDDLVSLGLGERDSLEKLVGRYIPSLFPGRVASVEDLRQRNRSARDVAGLFNPFTRRVTRLVIALGTAAMMLAPMVVLSVVKEERWKLGVVAGCTMLLAVAVALGTRGRGGEIVMVISAYAAVLVVFVQGDCGGRAGG